ncbi:hypothetical protein NKG94_13125 [Micromonospora sp. M12]
MTTPLKAATTLAAIVLLILTGAAPAQAANPSTRPPVSGSLGTYNVSGVYVAGSPPVATWPRSCTSPTRPASGERPSSPPGPTTAPRTPSPRRSTAAATTSTDERVRPADVHPDLGVVRLGRPGRQPVW